MAIQVVTIGVDELLGIFEHKIEDAYSTGYIKAKRELELEAAKAETKFNELLRGTKALKKYLEYKAHWTGSINTLSKVAYQLVADGDHPGHGLLFRCTYIDHAFKTGFCFKSPEKQKKVNKIS